MLTYNKVFVQLSTNTMTKRYRIESYLLDNMMINFNDVQFPQRTFRELLDGLQNSYSEVQKETAMTGFLCSLLTYLKLTGSDFCFNAVIFMNIPCQKSTSCLFKINYILFQDRNDSLSFEILETIKTNMYICILIKIYSMICKTCTYINTYVYTCMCAYIHEVIYYVKTCQY